MKTGKSRVKKKEDVVVNYELFTSGEMQWFGLEARCPAHGAPPAAPLLGACARCFGSVPILCRERPRMQHVHASRGLMGVITLC